MTKLAALHRRRADCASAIVSCQWSWGERRSEKGGGAHGGGGSGDAAALLAEHGGQFGHLLERHVRPRVLVHREQQLVLLLLFLLLRVAAACALLA